MIDLPYGGRFSERRLIAFIRSSGMDYIVQGQQSVALLSHTKPHSLDYWLREFARNQDTKQAQNSVIDALVATGLFRRARRLRCPATGRMVKGLRLRSSTSTSRKSRERA